MRTLKKNHTDFRHEIFDTTKGKKVPIQPSSEQKLQHVDNSDCNIYIIVVDIAGI